MNDFQAQKQISTEVEGREEIGFLDFALALAKRKRLLIGAPLVSAVAAGALTFALPDTYTATTTLMPPQQAQSSAAALLSQMGGVAGAVAGGAGLKNPNDMYIGMLKSQTVADRLIKKFNLKQVYGKQSQELTREVLAKKSAIIAGKDSLISITVEGTDKKLVAEMANGYVNELTELTKVLAVTSAGKRRMFYEHEFEQAKNNLAGAEMALKANLGTHGVVSVDSESRAIVETLGRLRAQATAKEIQLNSMSAFVTPNNPEYRKVQEELSSLKGQLAKLENGPNKDTLAEPQSTDTPAGLANVKLLRDVKYYQMLYELLAKQYEIARIDEAKDPAVIQVLDPAIEPERKAGPKHVAIAVGVFFLTLIIMIGWIIAKEGVLLSMMNDRETEKWANFKRQLRGKA